MKEEIQEIALLLAFEAGRWLGQVDLEEHYDLQQYTSSMKEVAYSRRNAMPIDKASTDRTVKVNLRSEEWRIGVKKSCEEYLNKARQLLSVYCQSNKANQKEGALWNE